MKCFFVQLFSLSNEGELRQDETCVSVDESLTRNKSSKLLMKRCAKTEEGNDWILEVCK